MNLDQSRDDNGYEKTRDPLQYPTVMVTLWIKKNYNHNGSWAGSGYALSSTGKSDPQTHLTRFIWVMGTRYPHPLPVAAIPRPKVF